MNRSPRWARRREVFLLVAVAVLALGSFDSARAALLAVNAVDDMDDGACDMQHCSLREAIEAANAAPGKDVISFLVPPFEATVHSIRPVSPLPPLSDPAGADILGLSQPASSANTAVSASSNAKLLIEINGELAGASANGLVVDAGTSRIEGLVVNGFAGDGIVLAGGSGHDVNNVFVGTDAAGLSAVANGGSGIAVLAPGSSVKWIVATGNLADGIRIAGGATGVLVDYSLIGSSAQGQVALGNGRAGIAILAPENTIGLPSASSSGAFGSYIAGNALAGILLSGSEARGNTVQSNVIDANHGHGVLITDGATDNSIARRVPGNTATNLFSRNAGNGVHIAASAGTTNTVVPWQIGANGGIPIDIEGGVEDGDGVTANDEEDSDQGPNGLQNAPLLLHAETCNGRPPLDFVCIDADFSGEPDQDALEFFYKGTSCDGSAQSPLYFISTTALIIHTNAQGHSHFRPAFPRSLLGSPPWYLRAMTMTFPQGNTSELSNCIEVVEGPTPTAGPQTPTFTRTATLPAPTSTHTFVPSTPTHTPTQVAPPSSSPTTTRTPTPPASGSGDANCDAAVTAADLIAAADQAEQGAPVCGADVLVDGRVDDADLRGIIAAVFR